MDLRSSVLVREGGRKILATTIMLHENAGRLSQGAVCTGQAAVLVASVVYLSRYLAAVWRVASAQT